jgi:hypothetical protein
VIPDPKLPHQRGKSRWRIVLTVIGSLYEKTVCGKARGKYLLGKAHDAADLRHLASSPSPMSLSSPRLACDGNVNRMI